MLDFLTFEVVITPYIVIFVYLGGMLLIPIIIYVLFKKSGFTLHLWQSVSIQILLFVFVELLWRMLNEFIIVYFKIYQALS